MGSQDPRSLGTVDKKKSISQSGKNKKIFIQRLSAMMDLSSVVFWHIQDYLSYGEVREGFQEEVSAELKLENQEIKAHKLYFNSLLSVA